MRRTPISSRAVVLTLALIYAAGMVLGIWLVSYLLGASKRPGLLYVANQVAAEYTETGTADPSPISGRAAIVYDRTGTVVDHFQAEGRAIHFDLAQQGTKYLSTVLSGKETLRLVWFAGDDTTLGYTSLMYVGIPLTADGEITGALFWVRELQDLLESVLGYICMFTIVFASVAVFLLLSQHNQRKYEQMRRDYVDNITHELKTPIAAIKALAEALSDGMEKSPADRNVYYGMILKEANRQERMVCDALELSRLQSYRMQMKKEPLVAAQVLNPVLEKYASLCDLMGITFTVDESVTALPTLNTSEKYIQTVMDALLGNAVKFVQEEGEIKVSARLSRRRVTITVEDNGVGIAKEELPHVFERFYKGHRSDNAGGSGLGLAIAKEITNNMKETIRIHSEEHSGTRVSFTVTLT